MLDEEIKNIFDNCEEMIKQLRKVFQAYMHKNKKTMEAEKLENMRKN